MPLLQTTRGELFNQEAAILLNQKSLDEQERHLFNGLCESFLKLSVISSNFVVRSLGSTLDLTAVALVKCQHAEGCGEPLKNYVTNYN